VRITFSVRDEELENNFENQDNSFTFIVTLRKQYASRSFKSLPLVKFRK
jgi:hypothetical protein